jgi:hypothetical protein
MPSSENHIPTVAEVTIISSESNVILRNLLITQFYHELSSAFTKRLGDNANWCSFATWASKQAGQTIRNEDLQRTLEALLKKETGIEDALSVIADVAKRFDAKSSFSGLRQWSIGIMLNEASKRASDAVSRGNKKVFEEIGFEFARFVNDCFDDDTYSQQSIERFCESLRDGEPPDGQNYLKNAFTNYYTSFFEKDEKKKTEAFYLANLQIGFHEQTRLQPEIAEALNAAMADTKKIKSKLLDELFKNAGFLVKIRLFFQRIFGKTALLDKAAEELITRLQEYLRAVLTEHLMTLTMPPDNRLQLGRDLAMIHHSRLKEITNPLLQELLLQVDPTPGSLQQSGASDWADLKERMHFIAELFRCYHGKKEMFDDAFTKEQVMSMKEGKLPAGKL